MKCPLDQSDLLMMERHGVEIDYCPRCRGVWLDRGELDKIIERATPAVELANPDPVPTPPPASPTRQPRPAHQAQHDDRHEDYKHAKRYKKKRRKSFLEEIFDFD